MKKWISYILCILLLTGCTANHPETSAPTVPEIAELESSLPETETNRQEIPLNIFIPNENADGFETIPTVIDTADAQTVLNMLIEHSMLNADIALNAAERIDRQLNLDFNQAFSNQLCSYGTAGERMMMGCVVNTFLSVYDVDCVYITVDGKILESGHVIYDFPMEYFE